MPHTLLGVSDPLLHDVMGVVMGERGARHVLVVRGEDGLDEVTIAGRTRVIEVRTSPGGNLAVRDYWLDPTSHGVARRSSRASVPTRTIFPLTHFFN